jgi:hypothetical protein
MVTPGDLKWVEVPSLPPGAKLAVIEDPLNEAVSFTFRLRLPADYKIPAHWHPAIEHVTVISGTFNMGTGDKLDPKQTKPLPAGSVAIMQPKTNHFAWTKEETIVQVHGVGSLMSMPQTIPGRNDRVRRISRSRATRRPVRCCNVLVGCVA